MTSEAAGVTTARPVARPARQDGPKGTNVYHALKDHMRYQLAAVAFCLMVLGLLCIVVYSFATSGPHWQYLAVGVITAVAVWVVGYLFGFLFGIPRIVSSGQLRLTMAPEVLAHAKAVAAGTPSDNAPAPRFMPSSNLAEVSDWLTKLLLGAGLVSLTKLGKPLGHLVNSIAAGLQDAQPPVVTGGPQVMAASIMFCYLTLGFLVGYILTSLWYSRVLQRMLDSQGHE